MTDTNNFQPNEVQQLKLENAQLKAKLALNTAQRAKELYDQAFDTLIKAVDAIKQENKWPDEVRCDVETLIFSVSPTPTVN
jgi:hypothetical protein